MVCLSDSFFPISITCDIWRSHSHLSCSICMFWTCIWISISCPKNHYSSFSPLIINHQFANYLEPSKDTICLIFSCHARLYKLHLEWRYHNCKAWYPWNWNRNRFNSNLLYRTWLQSMPSQLQSPWNQKYSLPRLLCLVAFVETTSALGCILLVRYLVIHISSQS